MLAETSLDEKLLYAFLSGAVLVLVVLVPLYIFGFFARVLDRGKITAFMDWLIPNRFITPIYDAIRKKDLDSARIHLKTAIEKNTQEIARVGNSKNVGPLGGAIERAKKKIAKLEIELKELRNSNGITRERGCSDRR